MNKLDENVIRRYRDLHISRWGRGLNRYKKNLRPKTLIGKGYMLL